MYDNMNNTFNTSLVAQLVKNLPVIQETSVQSVNWADPLKKGMATHSEWVATPGRLQFMHLQRVGHN